MVCVHRLKLQLSNEKTDCTLDIKMCACNILIYSICAALSLVFTRTSGMPTEQIEGASLTYPLEFKIVRSKHPLHDTLIKRSGLELGLSYEQDMFYATTLEVGTPPQKITLLVDTGSSDLWVSGTGARCGMCERGATCLNGSYGGQQLPSTTSAITSTFNANESLSNEKLDIGRFYTNYSDGSSAEGYWCQDKVIIGKREIGMLQFGIAETSSTFFGGVLGIGLQGLESVRGYADAPQSLYPNLPMILKRQNLISTNSYSLYLNSNESSLTFGTIDCSKFTGTMYTFPMVNQYPTIADKPTTLAVTLQGIGGKSIDCTQTNFAAAKMAVILDSGTSLMNVPEELLNQMVAFVNATYSESDQLYIVKCPEDNEDTKFTFDFGDVKIEVPLSSLVLLPPRDGFCGFGVQPTKGTPILGQVFLSSAYVVYDLDNYQISLAQANHDRNSSQKKIIHIHKNGDISGAMKAKAIPWSPPAMSFGTSNSLEISDSSYIASPEVF